MIITLEMDILCKTDWKLQITDAKSISLVYINVNLPVMIPSISLLCSS